TMFQDAVEKFAPLFKVGNIYIISKATIKHANKKFTSVRHDFELTFDPATHVESVPPSDPSYKTIPSMHFTFVPIDSIKDFNRDEMIDTIDIIKNIKGVEAIRTRSGNDVSKRDIEIVDTTNKSINVTFWGERAEHYHENSLQGHPVIAIKGVKVSDFKGKS